MYGIVPYRTPAYGAIRPYASRSMYVPTRRYPSYRRTGMLGRAIRTARTRSCKTLLRKKSNFSTSKSPMYDGLLPLLYVKPNKGYVVMFEKTAGAPKFHGVWKETNTTGMAKYANKQSIPTALFYDKDNGRADIAALVSSQRAAILGLSQSNVGEKRIKSDI